MWHGFDVRQHLDDRRRVDNRHRFDLRRYLDLLERFDDRCGFDLRHRFDLIPTDEGTHLVPLGREDVGDERQRRERIAANRRSEQEELHERLSDTPHIDASDVTVEVKNGAVTLLGTVPHRQMKHWIEDIAAKRSPRLWPNGVKRGGRRRA